LYYQEKSCNDHGWEETCWSVIYWQAFPLSFQIYAYLRLLYDRKEERYTHPLTATK